LFDEAKVCAHDGIRPAYNAESLKEISMQCIYIASGYLSIPCIEINTRSSWILLKLVLLVLFWSSECGKSLNSPKLRRIRSAALSRMTRAQGGLNQSRLKPSNVSTKSEALSSSKVGLGLTVVQGCDWQIAKVANLLSGQAVLVARSFQNVDPHARSAMSGSLRWPAIRLAWQIKPVPRF